MPEQLVAFKPDRRQDSCAWSPFCLDPHVEGSPFCLPHTRAALGLDNAWTPPMHDALELIDEIDAGLAERLEAEYEAAEKDAGVAGWPEPAFDPVEIPEAHPGDDPGPRKEARSRRGLRIPGRRA